MRVIAAPDSFKGSLSAPLAAQAIARGVQRACPACQVEEIPIADGGEGTLETLVAAGQGEYRTYQVQGPLGQPVAARIGLLPTGQAVIEMAQASGLTLVPPQQRNPLLTSSYGTGQLLQAALELGCRNLIITLGGSATVDGGIGMLAALGAVFYDEAEQELEPVGGSLPRVVRVDLQQLDRRLQASQIIIAADVTNPLCGPQGAAPVFGPQKGASPATVAVLAQGLNHWAAVTAASTGLSVDSLPGGGAAGGLGAALVAYAGGQIRLGSDVVLDTLQVDARLAGADLVITGEGNLDGQTAAGKAPVGIARRAQHYGCHTVAIVGGLGSGYANVYDQGIDGIFTILPRPLHLAQAMADTSRLLEDATWRVMHFYSRIRADSIDNL